MLNPLRVMKNFMRPPSIQVLTACLGYSKNAKTVFAFRLKHVFRFFTARWKAANVSERARGFKRKSPFQKLP